MDPGQESPPPTGYVAFRLGDRGFVAALDDVREVVRLTELETLPGMREPLAGVLDLRGTPLPVLDMRTAEGRGDVLVLGTEDGDVIGVAVDSVTAVRGPAEFAASADGAPPRGLPGYVVEVLYDLATGAAVLRVDVHRMLAVIG